MPTSEINFTIRNGIPEKHRNVASQLFCEAFEQKFRNILGPANETGAMLASHLNLNNAVCAITNEDQLAGIAGFQYQNKSFTDIPFKTFIQKFDFWKAIRRYILAAIIFHRKPDDMHQLLMDGIVVDERYRGMGIGSRLFDALTTFARQNRMQTIKLDVIDENPNARKLYERLGFKPTKHQKSPGFIYKITGVSGVTTMVKRL
jgi:ribosomal protein S18 acetylase RimI-like enzyme